MKPNGKFRPIAKWLLSGLLIVVLVAGGLLSWQKYRMDRMVAGVAGGDCDSARALVELAGSPDASLNQTGFPVLDETSISALNFAANAGNRRTMEYLIDAGANVNHATSRGETALMAAAKAGKTEACRFLLSKGAQVGARTTDGDTALMYACQCGRPDVVKLLLADGADLRTKNVSGDTPLGWAYVGKGVIALPSSSELARYYGTKQDYERIIHMLKLAGAK